MKIKKSNADRIFDFFNILISVLVAFIMLYPLYFTVIASLSDPTSVASGQVYFLPKNFTLNAYKYILDDSRIWVGYRNTIIYTILGTAYNIALTIPAAYVLSKKNMPFKGFFSTFFFITMYFSGGMIPSYLNMSNLGLLNTPWVMILGAGISCYNLIVSRQFFASTIPEELYEAANIDGCTPIMSFFKIAVPLSLPIIAVMSLYYGVGHWNSYFNALIYLTDASLYPLQLVLRNIIILNETVANSDTTGYTDEMLAYIQELQLAADSMKYSVIFISSAPLLAVYPFIQKFFVKGVMIGSVKG